MLCEKIIICSRGSSCRSGPAVRLRRGGKDGLRLRFRLRGRTVHGRAGINGFNAPSHDRVVSLYGSFAEAWMLSGGTLVGATQDAVDERHLDLGEDVSIVGTVKEPNLEEILALSPDFVILSSQIPAQVKLHQSLTDAGIPHAYFSGETFRRISRHAENILRHDRAGTTCTSKTARPSRRRSTPS
jgi:hypothetical protein